ncbi:hypothetical protein JXQ70_07935 [bacterium]|nr:hypothetical protein [bacterium]
MNDFVLRIQAGPEDTFGVQCSTDAVHFSPLWSVPLSAHDGLQTRQSPELSRAEPIKYLRIIPSAGNRPHFLGGISYMLPPLQLPHWVVIPALWVFWILLIVLSSQKYIGHYARLVVPT